MAFKKCNLYPNCKCFTDWEKPAIDIDADNAELFVGLLQEMKAFLKAAEWVEYSPTFDKAQSKVELLPDALKGLFISKTLALIDTSYSWKMPELSDTERLRKALLKVVSAHNGLSFYKDESNIPNQQLVTETIEYFETGEGRRAFKPLEFLNFFENSINFYKSITKTATKS